MLGKIEEWLKGKKTYLVMLAAIATAFAAYSNDALTLGELVTAVFAAIGAMTLRAGVEKSGNGE